MRRHAIAALKQSLGIANLLAQVCHDMQSWLKGVLPLESSRMEGLQESPVLKEPMASLTALDLHSKLLPAHEQAV